MNEALERDIDRIAKENGIERDTLLAEIDAYKGKGFNELSAWSRVKSDHSGEIRGIKDTYTVWPVAIGEPRVATWNEEEHEIADVLGIFYGRINKGTERSGFLLKMALVDDDLQQLSELRISQPSMFKGSFNPRKLKLYKARDAEFVEGTTKGCPDFMSVLNMAREDAVPLSKLMDLDSNGNLVYDQTDIAFAGVVGSAREFGDSSLLEISDIGSDPVTVWMPDDMSVSDAWLGKEVFGYGYYQLKDNGPSINAKVILPLEEE